MRYPTVCLSLKDMPDAAVALQLLFDEAFAQRCGRTTVLNRLFEVVLIQVLRQLMERSQVQEACWRAGTSAPAVGIGGHA
jgi:hypothetical protein